MPDTAAATPSFWETTIGDAFSYPELVPNLVVDVAVIGGGIVGLTAADRLSQEGKTVAVLEARRIGTQVTGRSSAKVTSQHGLMYSRLIEEVGEDNARLYAQANEAALQHIAALVEEEGMDCGFERKSAYVYTSSDTGVGRIEAELRAARALGLPARLTKDVEASVRVAAAVCFDAQAQFNPAQYLVGLAARVARKAQVFEMTRVVQVKDGEPCTLRTAGGATVTARDIVVATHQPIVPDGMYFSKAFPFSHTVIAAPIDSAKAPGGMAVTSEEPGYSFRDHRAGAGRYLIAVGPLYKTGVPEDEARSFRMLDKFIADTFGIASPSHWWTNEDFAPMDGLPFVGRAGSDSSHLFVAVGFNAWGITTGTAAATLINDLIVGRKHPLAPLFDATRIRPLKGGPEFIKGNFEAAKHFVGDRFGLPSLEHPHLAPGEARVAKADDDTVAAYRDESGQLHVVSAVCTHMGCLVDWNATDRTWDCPCHGSRFAVDGSVLHGPATAPLKNAGGEASHGSD